MRTVGMIVSLLVVGLGSAANASAALQVCNESPFLLYVAVGFHDGGAWKSRGWYPLDPGHCANVVGGDLTDRYYYIHAEDKSGDQTWGDGNVTFCPQPAPFTITGDDCTGRGFKTAAFSQVDTGDSKNFQYNLTCRTCTSGSGYKYTLGLPRISHSMSVAGRSVRVSASGKLDVDFTGSDLKAVAVIYSDLSDFQWEVGNILRAQVNHNDDCDYIINVHSVNVAPDGDGLRVYAAAHYEDWECPVVNLGPLGEIDGGKHRLFEQNGDVTAHLTPHTNGNDVWVSVNITGMEADGIFGAVLDSSWVGPYVRDLILQSIPEVFHIGSIRDSLPVALRSFPLRLNDVAFYDRGSGDLGLRVAAGVTVPAGDAEAVWKLLK